MNGPSGVKVAVEEGKAHSASTASPPLGDAAKPTASVGNLAPTDDAQPSPEMVRALAAWLARLTQAGVACRGAALHAQAPELQISFEPRLAGLQNRWSSLRQQVDHTRPLALEKALAAESGDWLLAAALTLPDGQPGVVGLALVPPCNDRTVQMALLSLGWLQVELSAQAVAHSRRAARLLELLAHVASQTTARSAAQEWINRAAAWVRVEEPALDAGFTLSLFEMRGKLARWWVSADTAWAETASPAVQEAAEVATQAALELREIAKPYWWALPVVDDGQVVAVLVSRLSADGAPQLPDAAVSVLRSSLGLGEPLLRHWRQADRPLWRHHLDALRWAWGRIWSPGHLVWKAGAVAVVTAFGVLLLWPVPDRVAASTVIEGRIRQVVTAPFDGFIGQVSVRPGDQVRRGQALARLDDRELKLEQNRIRSERDQAAGKLRQAMADRDAAALALAQADVQRAEAQLALADSKLGRTDLIAPVDGLLVSGDWVQQIGGPVETGKAMFEIAAGDGYRVVLHVPDRDIARVKPGQGGSLRLTGQPQVSYGFHVRTVTATASVQDSVNGFRVEADWDGEAPALSPGMQGIGKIEVGQSNLLTIWTRSSVDWIRLKIWSWWW